MSTSSSGQTPQLPAKPLVISASQQAVLDRIATQRARLKARHLQTRINALARAAEAQSNGAAGVPATIAYPSDSNFATRLVLFARQHPYVALAVAGGVLLTGPRRLLRIGTMAFPLIMKARRFMR